MSDKPQCALLGAAALWIVAIAMPSAPFAHLNGLPLSSTLEFVLLCVGAIAFLGTRPRAVLVRAISRFGRTGIVLTLGSGVLVLCLKLVLLGGAPSGGFAACYTNPVVPRAHGACELSYENLAFGGDVTRYDETIDFGPRVPELPDPTKLTGSDWNLSFVNDTRLNIYAQTGNLDVERLPFAARWTGEVDVDRRGWIPIRYIGEGGGVIGQERFRLPATYRHARTAFISVRSGDRQFRLHYEFGDKYLVGEGLPRGPYATLRVGQVQADPEAPPRFGLEAAPPALVWRIVAGSVDLALLALGLVLAASILVGLGQRQIPLFAMLAGLLAVLLTGEHFGFGPVMLLIPSTVVAFALLYLVLVYRRTQDLLLVGVPAALVLAVEGLTVFPDLHAVLFRSRGDDWQTYQSFARSILETGSLEGGERIFYYQPGFRYWVFGGHTIVGDGDALPAIVGLALLLVAVLGATRWSIGRATRGSGPLSPSSRLIVAVMGVALIVMMTSPPILELVVVGASEYPTWIILPVVPVLLFSRPTLWRWLTGSVLLALTVSLRPNQGIPALFLMGVFVLWQVRREPRRVAACSAVFIAVLLLPAVHNLWYGDRLVLLPTGASSVEDFPPGRWPDVFSDSSVRRLLLDKAAGLAYLSSKFPRDGGLGAAVLAVQVAWITALVRAFRRRNSVSWLHWCILFWPMTFAVHAVAYDVYIYYPRHVIAMYVAAATAVIFVEARYLSRVPGRSSHTNELSSATRG